MYHELRKRALVTARLVIMLRIEQPVHVDNEVAHVGVVDGLLGLRLPGRIGGRIVRINSDDVQLVEIPELDVGEITELSAKNEMEQLLARRFLRHGWSSNPLLSWHRLCKCYASIMPTQRIC